MRTSEKGFTYPLTLMMMLLFLMLFTVRVEQLLSDRKMAHEGSTILLQEYYYESTVKKVERMYQSSQTVPVKGTFIFTGGIMEYQTEKPIGASQKMNFTLKLNSGEVLIVHGYFDINKKRLIKWLEAK